jgi:hypothetical protein
VTEDRDSSFRRGALFETQYRDRGKDRHHLFVAVVVLIQTSNTFLRPPPSSDRAFAITALIFYTVFACVAFLLEKRRAISS